MDKLSSILNDLKNYIEHNKPKYIPNNKKQILYSGPYWDENEILAAIRSLISGKWVVSGENVYKFQNEFSKRFNVKYSYMVNSGSSANLIMISALKKYFKWDNDDEIIVSAVGFPTTYGPIIQNNLKPVFIDIEYETLNFDLNLIEEKITPKTKAIFVSPVLGNPPNIDKLIEICNKYNLTLIGDNCDSLGTKWKNKELGEYYKTWSCSFYPAHHISTGEGGMVCTDDEELYKLFISFSNWGRDCYCVGSANLLPCGTCGNRFDNWLEEYKGIVDHKYVFTNIGYNVKPLDLQGAIGLEQLKKFEEIYNKRINNKNEISKIILRWVDDIKTIYEIEGASTSWFGVPFICKNKEQKTELVNFFEENKIQTRNYFAGNILVHPGFKHIDDYKKYPNANLVLDNIFFIGVSPHYNEEVFNYIEKTFKEKWIN